MGSFVGVIVLAFQVVVEDFPLEADLELAVVLLHACLILTAGLVVDFVSVVNPFSILILSVEVGVLVALFVVADFLVFVLVFVVLIVEIFAEKTVEKTVEKIAEMIV